MLNELLWDITVIISWQECLARTSKYTVHKTPRRIFEFTAKAEMEKAKQEV